MSNLDLGLVTAYGYAKSQGYNDTEENFAIELANVKAYKEAAEAAAELAEDYKDEAFSGTPTGYEQLVSDVYSLETEEDSVLAATPTFVGRVLLDKMYGMSTQATTPTPSSPVDIKSAKANFWNSGKNLVEIETPSSVLFTFTENNDGSVTISGSSANDYAGAITKTIKFKKAQQYKLSGCPSGGGSSSYRLQLYDFTTNTTLIYDSGDGATFTPVVGHEYKARIYVTANYVMSNITFKPMITLVDADQTFEAYQGQSVTTDLTLRAIEVSSNDSEQEIYNHTVGGRKYAADELKITDGGYLIDRYVKVVTLTQNMTYSTSSLGTDDNYQTFVTNIVYDTSSITVDWRHTSALSDRLNILREDASFVSYDGAAAVLETRLNQNILAIFFKLPKSIASSTDALKQWLTNTPIHFYIANRVPTTESISNADAKKLLSLKSYDEATYVAQTEDTEGVMVLKYGSTELSNMAVTGYVEGKQNSIRLTDLESAV